MAEPDAEEAARRLRAALAYKGLTRAQAADALSVSLATLDRMTGRRGDEKKTPSWNDLWKAAEACDLPPEWFSADLDRLAEIVTEGPVVRRRVGAGLPAPPGDLGRLGEADAPTGADRQPRTRRRAADDPPGSA